MSPLMHYRGQAKQPQQYSRSGLKSNFEKLSLQGFLIIAHQFVFCSWDLQFRKLEILFTPAQM